MEQAVWQTGRGGVVAAHLGECRTRFVRVNGWVRYQVFRREGVGNAGRFVLLASGNHDGVCAAMDAAERVARTADDGRGWRAGARAA